MTPSRILFFLFLSSFLNATANPATPVSIREAVARGWVKALISADSLQSTGSSHYGQCLRLQLTNLGKSPLNLLLENGRFLETADTNEQRMIVTRQELISLQGGKMKSIPVYAMCSQMHDRSPGETSALSPGPMAEGNLLTLTRFLEKHNIQGQAGQEAVWVITDNNDIGSIYLPDEHELKLLQEMVSSLTGKPVPKAPHRIEFSDGSVSGTIVFDNQGKETYTLSLFNESGEVLLTFFEEKTIETPMHTTLNWKFRYKGFPKGVYYVKLHTEQQVLVASRPVIIR